MEIMTVLDVNTGKRIKVLADEYYLRGDLLIYSDMQDGKWILTDGRISVVDWTHNGARHKQCK